MAHVAGDGVRAADGIGVVEDTMALLDEPLGLRGPDLLVALREGAVGVSALSIVLGDHRKPACLAALGRCTRRALARRHLLLTVPEIRLRRLPARLGA